MTHPKLFSIVTSLAILGSSHVALAFGGQGHKETVRAVVTLMHDIAVDPNREQTWGCPGTVDPAVWKAHLDKIAASYQQLATGLKTGLPPIKSDTETCTWYHERDIMSRAGEFLMSEFHYGIKDNPTEGCDNIFALDPSKDEQYRSIHVVPFTHSQSPRVQMVHSRVRLQR